MSKTLQLYVWSVYNNRTNQFKSAINFVMDKTTFQFDVIKLDHDTINILDKSLITNTPEISLLYYKSRKFLSTLRYWVIACACQQHWLVYILRPVSDWAQIEPNSQQMGQIRYFLTSVLLALMLWKLVCLICCQSDQKEPKYASLGSRQYYQVRNASQIDMRRGEGVLNASTLRMRLLSSQKV